MCDAHYLHLKPSLFLVVPPYLLHEKARHSQAPSTPPWHDLTQTAQSSFVLLICTDGCVVACSAYLLVCTHVVLSEPFSTHAHACYACPPNMPSDNPHTNSHLCVFCHGWVSICCASVCNTCLTLCFTSIILCSLFCPCNRAIIAKNMCAGCCKHTSAIFIPLCGCPSCCFPSSKHLHLR